MTNMGLVKRWPLATTLARARAFAERLVTQRGATIVDIESYCATAADWSG